jgi:type II secretory pathway pseudopilin PulG
MAIRPADLQLAYLAAPANSAVASQAQNGAQTAQQAAQAAFAAQIRDREETVAESASVEGNLVRSRGDEPHEHDTPEQRERRQAQGDSESGALGMSGDGEHFIDVTA